MLDNNNKFFLNQRPYFIIDIKETAANSEILTGWKKSERCRKWIKKNEEEIWLV